MTITRRALPRLAAALALCALAAVLVPALHQHPVDPYSGVDPITYTDPQWGVVLSGEHAFTKATYTALSQVPSGLSDADAQALARASALVVRAELTSPGSIPPLASPRPAGARPAGPRCAGRPTVLAASPVAVAGTSWVKSLVAYSGRCDGRTSTLGSPAFDYVYFTRGADRRWTPVWSWQLRSPLRTRPVDLSALPGSLVDLPCSTGRVRVRPAVAVSFGAMCRAARADGVSLVATDGWRSRQDQKSRFDQALDFYRTPDAARAHVAYADADVCLSRHCQGLAVGVTPSNQAGTWLGATVACASASKVSRALTCPVGQVSITRAETFGFTRPAANLPGYLEYVLPAGLGSGGRVEPDCVPYGMSAPMVVAAVFRCRLAATGLDPQVTGDVVAQAEVVSRCASNWSAATSGVFGLPATMVSSGWVQGELADPVASANAAASLWLAEHGWSFSACGTGQGRVARGAVPLSAYRSGRLPSWARSW